MRATLAFTVSLAGATLLLLPVATAPGHAASPREPLLGVVLSAGRPDVLARIDPRSLRPLGSARVPLRRATAWAFSPDRAQLAFASDELTNDVWPREWIRIVDPLRLRQVTDFRVGRGFLFAAAWVAPDRLVALQQTKDGIATLVVDPVARRVVDRRLLECFIDVRRTRDELVVLEAPKERIGPARLHVLGVGRSLTVALHDISAGSDGDPHGGRTRHPALAVDATGRHAYVIPPAGAVAVVDLASGEVDYHALAERRSSATAKISEGEVRRARWLGGGLIAVTGADYARAPATTRPAGLRLIDVRDWSVRTLDDRATNFAFAEGVLLATGFRADFIEASTGLGVTAYDLDGKKRFHVLDGEAVNVSAVLNGRAYLWRTRTNRRAVVDLETGRVTPYERPLPRLIREPDWLDA